MERVHHDLRRLEAADEVLAVIDHGAHDRRPPDPEVPGDRSHR
jgi:hypothetical protein